MNGWNEFNNVDLPYTEVTPEYAEWSERVATYNASYLTFQDAVEALEGFV
tara:strand:- start:297 stop:446 length:150 start_codon:yes stop_codon:yes gene_type:complete